MDIDSLLERAFHRDRTALAKLITCVETRSPEMWTILRRIWPRAGRARVVGITGPPGAGKSTLVARLTSHLRGAGHRVGIVAVDPSSPFSGGAVLGDRIRMQDHFLDEDVFIRSLSTRGRHGGLARATRDVVRLLDAYGMDTILVETVGVGQTELDIMRVADTTLVVLVPESGDTVQVMKAGLLEIADVFVVNKADREGADRLAAELQSMVHMSAAQRSWEIPVLLTEATRNVGIDEILATLDRHHEATEEVRQSNATKRWKREVLEVVSDELALRLQQSFEAGDFSDVLDGIDDGSIDPYGAAVTILEDHRRLSDILAKITERA